MGLSASKYPELSGWYYDSTVESMPSQKGKLIAITGCTRSGFARLPFFFHHDCLLMPSDRGFTSIANFWQIRIIEF